MRWIRPTMVGLALLLVTQFASAQNNFNGSWKSNVVVNGQGCTFNLVMSAGQHYTEMLQCGTLATSQSGTYVFANGTLVRKVTNWAPKQQYVKTATGGYNQPTAKPSGGSFRVSFTNADTMVWVDVNFGGSLTYLRVK